MNNKITISVWCCFLAMSLLGMAMWPAWHVVPPPAATMSAAETAALVRGNQTGFLVGGILVSFALSFLFVFMGGLTACLRKMEGPVTPLTDTYMMIMPFAYFPILLLGMCFIVAAFRPDMPDDIVRMLVDFALLLLVFPAAPGLVMFVVIGFIILGDKNPQPIFPRWTGYLGIWTGILSVPGFACALFKTGPFAWNGILAFWLPMAVFGILLTVILWAMLRAAKHPAMQG